MIKTLATAKWLRFNRSLIDPDRSDPWFVDGMAAVRLACGEARCDHGYKALCSDSLEIKILGNYTVAILATIGLVIVFTVPVVWQFLQPNDDDFGDISKKPKQ